MFLFSSSQPRLHSLVWDTWGVIRTLFSCKETWIFFIISFLHHCISCNCTIIHSLQWHVCTISDEYPLSQSEVYCQFGLHIYLCLYSDCNRSCLLSGITIEWQKPMTFGDAEIDYYQLMVCFNVFFRKSNILIFSRFVKGLFSASSN